MRLLYRILRRFRSLVRREALESELSEELQYHVDRQIAKNVAGGMTPPLARHAALLELGGVEQIKEKCRDMRRTQWFETTFQDIRFGIRTFRKRPGFTLSVLGFWHSVLDR
jgi:putative ABC transport system permease protein